MKVWFARQGNGIVRIYHGKPKWNKKEERFTGKGCRLFAGSFLFILPPIIISS